MKYILTGMLAVLLSISQVSAGILEYNMGQKVKTNASKEESVDAVETIKISPPKIETKYNYTPKYDFGEYYRYYSNQTQSSYRNPAVTRGGSNYSAYYEDVLSDLEQEAKDVKRELEYVEDRIYDIEKELRRNTRYNSYYQDRLKDEKKHLKERKKDLEKLEKNIDEDISKVKKNKKHYKKYNRYNDRYYNYPSYKYRNYYGDYYYYHRQNFVNPDLKDVKEGRIYIR